MHMSSPGGRRTRVREITSADGTRIVAETFGSESSGVVTFVLAHGWTENRTYWIHQIRALTADGHRVVAFDLRGHGDSEAAPGADSGAADRLTPPSHAKRIAELLPALERPIILPDAGHMGPLERPEEIAAALGELAGRVLASSGAFAV